MTTLKPLVPLLSALLLGACASAPRPAPPAPPAPVVAPTPAPRPAIVVHEGTNYRYVERPVATVEAEQAPPFWLTSFDNVGRIPVLPLNNQGVALVLQAPVGVPKLLVEEASSSADRVHVRIVNRGENGLGLEITCLNRNPPNRNHANVILRIGPLSMIDLVLDTPSKERNNLMLRVR